MWRSRLVQAGLLIWVVCLAGWGAIWFVEPAVAGRMGATFATFLLGGKFAGVPTGLSLGLHPILVGLVVSLPDAGAVLVTYPLLDKGWETAGRWSHVLNEARERAMKDAQARRGLVARFGSAGLFIFSLTPIAFISPIVVAAIGQLMGLSPRRVLVPVLAGIAVLATLLVLAFHAGLRLAARVHPLLPFVLTGLIIAGLLTREIVLRSRARRRRGST